MSKKRSLYRILFYSHFFLTSVIVLVIAVLVYRQQVSTHRHEVEQRLRQETAYFANLVATTDSALWHANARDFQKKAHVRITVMDRSGVVLFETGASPDSMDNHGERSEFLQALQNFPLIRLL